MIETGKKVCIIKDKNVIKKISKALEPFREITEKTVRSYSSIVIKPNLCGGVHGEPGSHTSVAVLEAVVNILSSFAVPLYIGEADCSFNDAQHVFNSFGIHAIAKKYNARVVNLSEGPYIDREIPHPNSIKMLRISRLLAESMIVSVPVLKTHPWSGITINMKNMYGATYEREKALLHNGLEKNIVDINKVICPHLCIVDASVAVVCGGFKYGLWVGCPSTTMDMIITGINPVAVDAVGTKILGRDPWAIGHIGIAAKQGLGVCDVKQLTIVNNDIDLHNLL